MIECGKTYTVIEIVDEGLLKFANYGFEKLVVGDRVMLEYESYVDERYLDRSWPMAYLVYKMFADGSGRKIGRVPKRNINSIVAHDPVSKCAYRLATPEEAEAVFADVPVEDVLV